MRHFRDVDATGKWMHQAVREDMIVPALATAVVGEIEAQAAHIAVLENTISEKAEEIASLSVDILAQEEAIGAHLAKIARMEEIVESLGIKAKVLEMLREEF